MSIDNPVPTAHVGPALIALGTRRIAYFTENLKLDEAQQDALVKWAQEVGVAAVVVLVSMYQDGEDVLVPSLHHKLDRETVLNFFRQTAHRIAPA